MNKSLNQPTNQPTRKRTYLGSELRWSPEVLMLRRDIGPNLDTQIPAWSVLLDSHQNNKNLRTC